MDTSRLQTLLSLAAACTLAQFATAADAPRGRPIEYSEPRSERTNTTTSATSRSSLLDQLEGDFAKPFDTIKPGDSLRGMVLPAPQPTPVMLPNHRSRAANRRSDNYLLPAEELYLPAGIEESLKAPQLTEDGRNVKSLTPTERMLRESFDKSHGLLATNQMGFGPGRNGMAGGSPIYSPANPDGQQRTLGMDTDSASSKLRELREAQDAREMYGLGGGFGGPRLTASELQRRDQIMQLYNPNYTPQVPGAIPAPGVFSTPYVDSSFYDPPKAAPAVPVLAPSAPVLPPVNYAPAFAPQPEPEKPAFAPASSSPFMTVPRRNF